MADLVVDAEPEVLPVWNPTIEVTDRARLWWEPPRKLSIGRYGADAWSGVGVDLFNPVQVNDGDIANAAFRFMEGAGTSYVVFNCGDVMPFCAARVSVDTSLGPIATMRFEYSDDVNAPLWWSAPGSRVYSRDIGVIRSFDYQFGSEFSVQPRYWRLRRNTGQTAATAVTEIWLRTYIENDPATESYRLFSTPGGLRSLVLSLSAADCPTAAAPLDVTAIVPIYTASYETQQAGHALHLDVAAVADGQQSVPLGWSSFATVAATVFHAPNIPQKSTTLTGLVNGLNSNVVLPIGPGTVAVKASSGVSANFSFGGFVRSGFQPGADLIVQNYTGLTMSFEHFSAASLAANRILTPNGATVSIVGRGYAHLKAVDENGDVGWWLLDARDSTGYK